MVFEKIWIFFFNFQKNKSQKLSILEEKHRKRIIYLKENWIYGKRHFEDFSVNFCCKFLKFLPHVVSMSTYICTCAILKFLKKY